MGKSLTCFGKFLMLLGQILIVVNGQILKSILVWSHRPTPSFKEVNRIGKFMHILVWPKIFLKWLYRWFVWPSCFCCCQLFIGGKNVVVRTSATTIDLRNNHTYDKCPTYCTPRSILRQLYINCATCLTSVLPSLLHWGHFGGLVISVLALYFSDDMNLNSNDCSTDSPMF